MVAARSLNSPVASLSKVKPTDAKRLSKLGIETIRDLLLTLPFDWEIYGAPRRIAELRDGEPATVVGRISSSVAQVTYRKRVRLTQATLTDDDGGVMRVVESSGRQIRGVQKREPTLEDAFVKLVGRGMAEEEQA